MTENYCKNCVSYLMRENFKTVKKIYELFEQFEFEFIKV